MKESKTTIDDLAKKIDGVAKSVDDLAVITKKGFDAVGKQFEGVNSCMNTLENGQEDIKLRLNNVAYRFEFIELQRRIILLEKKAGFAK